MTEDRPTRLRPRRRAHAQDMVPLGDPVPALDQPAPPAKPDGWLAKWLRKLLTPPPKGAPGPGVTVAVARLAGDSDGAATAALADLLRPGPALKVKLLDGTFDPPPGDDEVMTLAAAAPEARRLMEPAQADLLVWGRLLRRGAAIDLRLTPARRDADERPGHPGDAAHLTLPVAPGEALGALLRATVQNTGANGAGDGARAALAAVEPTLASVQSAEQVPPLDLDARERCLLQAAFGHLCTAIALRDGGAQWISQAEDAFTAALVSLNNVDSPLDWAMVQRGRAWLRLARVERGPSEDVGDDLEHAIGCLESALRVFDQATFPLDWATLQFRLALALQRLDREDGDPDLLKRAITAYQAAMKVFTRAEAPLRWAELLNGLALAAQLLGEDLKSRELLEKAVQACRSALEVRTRATMPAAWAATRHNMASALFLLGKTTLERAPLEEARTIFAEVRDHYGGHGADAQARIAARNLARVESVLDTPRLRPPRHDETETESDSGSGIERAESK